MFYLYNILYNTHGLLKTPPLKTDVYSKQMLSVLGECPYLKSE